jgi:DNA polymerase III delta prime subunit
MIEMNDPLNYLWVEKFRPKTIADTILPNSLKKTFQNFVNNKEIPNLILSGKPGIGKTTVARAMLDELGCEYIIINGSLEGRQIDTLRLEILNFATSLSLTSSGRKYVIIDEADYLNPNSIQPALRNFMEEYSSNCGFILTCNYKHKIIEPLHSRCSVIEFSIRNDEKAHLAVLFMKRALAILDQENIKYDKATIAQLINKFFPDWRRVLNELQRYSVSGKIDSGIFINMLDSSIKTLFGYLKSKDFTSIRKWVIDYSDIEPSELYRQIYDLAPQYIKSNSLPALVLVLAKYGYQDSFALDKQINTVACLVEIIVEVEWK